MFLWPQRSPGNAFRERLRTRLRAPVLGIWMPRIGLANVHENPIGYMITTSLPGSRSGPG